MNKLFLRLGVGLAMLPTLTLPFTTFAAPTPYNLSTMGSGVTSAGDNAGLSAASDLPTIIGRVVSVMLGVLGLVFVILVVYAGFLYLTSNGEEKNVGKAKKLLTQAVIGLVIIVSAYAITFVVTDALTTITQ